MIKSYRGRLADTGQDTVNLHTNDGKAGYRIKKLQIIGEEPGQETVELVLKMYKVKQTTVDNAVNFADNTLLGVAYYLDSSSTSVPQGETIIFDQEVFNQDIYITAVDTSGSARSTNYYFELEKIDLTKDQALIAIVKNLRNEQ